MKTIEGKMMTLPPTKLIERRDTLPEIELKKSSTVLKVDEEMIKRGRNCRKS